MCTVQLVYKYDFLLLLHNFHSQANFEIKTPPKTKKRSKEKPHTFTLTPLQCLTAIIS